MKSVIQSASLQIAAAALLAGAVGLLTVALALALAPAVGGPLACVIVASMLALAGGGMLLGAQRSSPPPPPERPTVDPVTSALAQFAADTVVSLASRRR